MIEAIYKITKRWLERPKTTGEDLLCALEGFYDLKTPEEELENT